VIRFAFRDNVSKIATSNIARRSHPPDNFVNFYRRKDGYCVSVCHVKIPLYQISFPLEQETRFLLTCEKPGFAKRRSDGNSCNGNIPNLPNKSPDLAGLIIFGEEPAFLPLSTPQPFAYSPP
jgi:hypothetical protein